MVLQPEVFLSASPIELAPYREVVKETLREMGIKPVEHTDMNVAYGPLDGVLKLEIGQCDAVIHLVGSTFGPEPLERTHGAVRRSFQHYEFDVARTLNKEVFCFVTEPGTQTIKGPIEDDEAMGLQAEHRRMIVKSYEHWKFLNAEALAHHLRQLRPRLMVRRRFVRVPYAMKKAKLFGRERTLTELCDAIAGSRIVVVHPPEKFAAISAGAGKTVLAVEAGWRLYESGRFDFVFHIPAGSRMEIESALAALARMDALALVQEDVSEHRTRLNAVLGWLGATDREERVLLILDGVDHEVTWWAVKSMLPGFANAHVVITSRLLLSWPEARSFPVGSISMDASVELLAAPGGSSEPSARERDHLEHLARMLSWQPSALSLAGRLLAYGGMSAEKLVQILTEVAIGPANVRWHALYSRLVREGVRHMDGNARAFLHVLVSLAPEPATVPLAIFAGRSDAGQTRTILNQLARFGLIGFADDEQSLVVPRMTREMIRDRMTAEEMAAALDAARALIEAALPRSERTSGGAGARERIVPHCRVLLGQLNGHPLEVNAAHLARGLAVFLRDCGRMPEAEHFQRRAVHIVERRVGSNHPELAPELRRLANILQEMRQHGEAESLHRRAVAILRKQNPPSMRDLVAELYALAGCLRAAGRFYEAKPVLEEVLSIEEKQSGRGHPRTGIAVHTLAMLLEVMQRTKEALPLYRRALEIDEHSPVPSPARIAVRLHNLATTLRKLGENDAAIECEKRALEIDEATFGKYHPELVIPLGQFAGLIEEEKGAAAAEPHWRRAVSCAEGALDPGDAEAAAAMVGLAAVCRELGKGAEAKLLAERALTTLPEDPRNPHPLPRTVRELARQILGSQGTS
ncbi:MAG TPA: tetratricopeptide repeat protein [Chthoniobacteraceae bacterium]|nr:tetratricopeptide repeat protein [Chthoniobacteraceae bacterium]